MYTFECSCGSVFENKDTYQSSVISNTPITEEDLKIFAESVGVQGAFNLVVCGDSDLTRRPS